MARVDRCVDTAADTSLIPLRSEVGAGLPFSVGSDVNAQSGVGGAPAETDEMLI